MKPIQVSLMRMTKYDVNLSDYMDTWESLSLFSITGIMKDLIVALEIIHDCGYVYNDLRLENIMLR